MASTGRLSGPLADVVEKVDALLSQYVALENEFVAVSSSLFARLFRRFEFGDFAERVRDLRATLGGPLLALEDVRHHLASPGETRFAEHLYNYIFHLGYALSLLQRIADGMAHKSQRTSVYRWRDYKKDFNEYKSAVDTYARYGQELNRLLELCSGH